MGPFQIASAQRKFLPVATHYFTKWVEVEPLTTIIERKVENMVGKDIICYFCILAFSIIITTSNLIQRHLVHSASSGEST